VVFIGSEAGILLKVLAKTSPLSLNDSVLLEEIDVFNQAKYVLILYLSHDHLHCEKRVCRP